MLKQNKHYIEIHFTMQNDKLIEIYNVHVAGKRYFLIIYCPYGLAVF